MSLEHHFRDTAEFDIGAAEEEIAATLGGTAANDNGVGSIDWLTPNNALSDTDAGASATFNGATDEVSHFLKITNFGFAVPAGATVTGIVATIRVKADQAAAAVINIAKLVLSGSVAGSSESASEPTENEFTVIALGDSTELWGNVLTPAVVNNSGFGIAVSYQLGDEDQTVSIDWIKLRVFYTFGDDTTHPIYATQNQDKLLNFGGATWVEAQIDVDAPVGTNTDPELVMRLQASMDGTNWNDILTFATVEALATRERKSANRFSATPGLLGLYWRWLGAVTTSTGEATYTVRGTLLLGSEGDD